MSPMEAAAPLHQTGGYFLMSLVQQNDHDLPQATHRPLWDPVCHGADITPLPPPLYFLFCFIYFFCLYDVGACRAVLCFYSNSGRAEFPFGSVVINLSLLISCIPQAFQQGGLKAESCIVD